MPDLPDPTCPDGHDADVDVVPGTPPVPITVWRTPTPTGDGPLGDRFTTRLLSAYTRRGDLVYDTTGQTAVQQAAAASGRRYQAATRRGTTTGPAALVVACWPPPDPAAIDPVITLGGWRRRIGPGGVLAAIITNPAGQSPVELAPLVHAAGQAGLSYLQHIVAVHAHTHGDQLTPPPPPGRQAPAVDAAPGRGAAHLRVHTDVLIFQPLAGTHARP